MRIVVGMLVLLMAFSVCADDTASEANTEDDFNDSLCHTIGGKRETRHYYTYGEGQQGYVHVGDMRRQGVIGNLALHDSYVVTGRAT